MHRNVNAARPPPERRDIADLPPAHPALLVALVCSLALLVVYAELPGRPLILHTLQKLAHPLVFGVIASSAVLLQLQRPPRAAHAGVAIQYLLALLAAIAVGAATEIAQFYSHRDPALRDVGLDARGAACALAWLAVFDRRCRPAARTGVRRALYALVAVALTVTLLTPLAMATAAYANRTARFPALLVARSRLDLYFVSAVGGPVERLPVPARYAATPAEMALRVPLTARPYAGLSLDEPVADWRGFRTLVIEVVNPGNADLMLNVRVHDRFHTSAYADRFNAAVPVPHGQRRQLEFPIEAIRTAPRGRALDLAHVAGVGLFRDGPGGPREFWLVRVGLR